MILTPAQIQELTKIIEKKHLVFISHTLGSNILSKDDINLLKGYGVDVAKLSKYGTVDEAFRFGILADALGSKKAKKMSYNQFKKHLSSGEFIPLTKAEQIALDHVKIRMYGDVKGLGNRISSDFKNIAIESSKKKRKHYENILRETITEGVEKRKTVREIASDLGHKTKDWARDFDRIADYVLHEAFDTGKAISIQKQYGDEAYVHKQVYPGACEHCVRLYLTAGIGSKPKIFKVSTLIGNGTNIGLKQADWKPVLGSTHPWCRCETFYLPPNHEWDNKEQDFKLKRETYGIKRKSKIKISIS